MRRGVVSVTKLIWRATLRLLIAILVIVDTESGSTSREKQLAFCFGKSSMRRGAVSCENVRPSLHLPPSETV